METGIGPVHSTQAGSWGVTSQPYTDRMSHQVIATGVVPGMSSSALKQLESVRTASRPRACRMVFVALAIAGTFSSMVPAQSPKPFALPQEGMVLFRDVTLIDGTGGPERKGMDILVIG